MKWFNNPQSLEELKKQYKKLAFQNHPDCGGDTKDMQEINNEYDSLFAKLKDIHTNANGETYTSTNQTEETPEIFKDIIAAIIHFADVTIEIIGGWLWISGNTYPYKEILKQHNFKFSGKKSAWYFHNEPFKKKSKKDLTLDDIREMYGAQTVNTVQLKQLSYN